jgi:YVTN family beta-propeller protein
MSNRDALRLGVLAAMVCANTATAQIVLYTVDVADHPNALAVDTIDHTVYVSCEGSDSVYVLDATANSPEEAVVARVRVGDYPVDVAWNPADNTMWVVNKEINSPAGSVTVIDAGNDSVIATVDVGAAPFKAVWTSAGNKLYTLQHKTVDAIDCANRQVVSTIQIPGEGWGFTDMVYNPSMDRLYLIAKRLGQPGRLYVVDCTVDQIIQAVSVGIGAVKICYAPSVNRVFVACTQGTLNVFDCAAGSVIAWLTIEDDPTSVVWSAPPVNRVWVGCGWGHTVLYMRADTLGIEGRVDTPDMNPSALLYNPLTTEVFVASEQTHEIIVINARIPGIIDTLRLSPSSYGPHALALYQRLNRVYVANYWDQDPGTVAVLLCFVGIGETADRRPLFPSHAVPNPVRAGKLVALQASGFEPMWATLVDVLGRTVYQGCLGRNSAMTAPEEPGVYFYTVTDWRLTSSGKFTVR